MVQIYFEDKYPFYICNILFSLVIPKAIPKIISINCIKSTKEYNTIIYIEIYEIGRRFPEIE